MLPLRTVLSWESEAASRGVSNVARSSRGFLRAYEKAGTSSTLSPEWHARREAFIKRHMAQVNKRGEPLFDSNGRPSRRHLALIMWAYSPSPSKLSKARKSNPSPILASAVRDLYPHVTTWIHYPQTEGKMAKMALFEAYKGLSPAKRKAYDEAVREAFVRAHGSEEAIGYRYKRTDRVGGASLTTKKPRFKHVAYRIRPEHVLVHWAQTEMPLGGKAFGHEKEVILRPDARPPSENPGAGPALTARDKKVIDAFLDHQMASGKVLDSDGRTLRRMWLGAEDIAVWMGDRIIVTSTESTRFDQTILRYLRKTAKASRVRVERSDAPHAKGLRFFVGSDMLYPGQFDGWILAYVPGRKLPVGRLDYSEFDGQYSVKMVEVDPKFRRHGVATALYERLFQEHGIGPEDLDTSMLTEEGAELRESLRPGRRKNPVRRSNPVIERGVVLLMDGMKFKVTKASDRVLDVVGVPGRSGAKGHEGYKFFVYLKGHGDDRTFILTPATSKGVPDFMESDDTRRFRNLDVTMLRSPTRSPNPAPVRVDKEAIKRLAAKIRNRYIRLVDQKESDWFRLDDVEFPAVGGPVSVDVQVEANIHKPEIGIGAGIVLVGPREAGKIPSRYWMRIIIDGPWWEVKSLLTEELERVLLHEATHVGRIRFIGKGYHESPSDDDFGKYVAYINDREEVEARAQEIADQVIRTAERHNVTNVSSAAGKRMRAGGKRIMTVDDLLNTSTTWHRVHTYLYPENERKIREKAARALVDAGIFAPGMPTMSLNRIYPLYSDPHVFMLDRIYPSASKSAKAFVDELERLNGEFRKMPIELMAQRDRVLERYEKKGWGKLWDAKGEPTRRHLELLAWAFSPHRDRMDEYLNRITSGDE